MAEEKAFETHYSRSWSQFKQTYDYLRAASIMEKKGMKQPFIDNILRLAFDAGYNSNR